MSSDDEEQNSAILPPFQPDAFLDSDEEDINARIRARRSRRANRADSPENEEPPSTHASLDRDLSGEANRIILETYRATWTEFYEWEPTYSTQILRSLASESPSQPAAEDYGLEDSDWCLETSNIALEDLDDDVVQFDVWQWTDEQTARRLVTPPAETITPNGKATPHPRYEACTPCHSLIDGRLRGNKGGSGSSCEFIKYAGQRGFNEAHYLQAFYSVGWQERPWRDPDHRVIAYNTIRKLTAWAEDGTNSSIPIYVDDIDDSQVFYHYQGLTQGMASESKAGHYTVAEILFGMRQRDDLDWPGNVFGRDSCHTYVPIWRYPSRAEDQGKLYALTSMFCPNLHCMVSECFAHTYPTGWCSSTTQDAITNEEMLVTREPCGEHCFLKLHSEDLQNDIDWESEPDVEALDAILLLASNTLPCSFRTLLPQIPCYKIFARRAQIVQGSPPSQAEQQQPDFFVDDIIYEDDPRKFIIPERCAHEGPCGPQSQPPCECYAKDVHCRRNCQCSMRCVRRYKGCHCDDGTNACTHSHRKRTCKCLAVGRECDPELCKHRSKPEKGKTVKKAVFKCKNTHLQQSIPAPLVVRAGTYGLGAFAGKNINSGTFLGAYLGEIFWGSDGFRIFEHEYSGLNYSFTHNKEQFIDAQNAGNETRYINHAESDKANVGAHIWLVNGEQQIGFFAIKPIRAGQELFFDYGADYWKNTRTHS